MKSKIDKLLQNGSIKQVHHPHPEGWLSSVFLVPKEDGGFRMILNLKPLNQFIHYQKFKMDHINDVLHLIEPKMVLCSLDISNAFNQVFVDPRHHRFLYFEWENKFYEFRCLAQGATCSPGIFVHITTPVMKFLRSRMVRIMIYIDDTLIMAKSLSEMSQSLKLTTETMENAGFVLNYSKSQLTPTTKIDFLGFTIDTIKFTVSLTDSKLDNLIKSITNAMGRKVITIRELSRIIGKIVATFPSCRQAPLHYRVLERFKIKMLRQHKGKYSKKIVLNASCFQELNWWKEHLDKDMVTRSLHAVEISQHVFTDASLGAFGGCWGDRTIQSKFTEQQAGLSINTKELLAIFYTISAFGEDLAGENVLVHCDNMVAVSCVCKFGSKDPLKDHIVRELFQLAQKYNFTLQGTWVSGKANSRADRLSRKLDLNPRLEWSIPQNVFDNLCNLLPWHPDIDLFASHLNNKCAKYCSRMTNPHCLRVDAFTLNWSDYCSYIFSPFRLLHKILKKIEDDNVERAMVIAPLHTSQSWFPKFLSLCRSPPILASKKHGKHNYSCPGIQK